MSSTPLTRVKQEDLVVGRVYGVSGNGCMRLVEGPGETVYLDQYGYKQRRVKTTLTMKTASGYNYWAGIEQVFEIVRIGHYATCAAFARSFRNCNLVKEAEVYEAWQKEIDEGRMP